MKILKNTLLALSLSIFAANVNAQLITTQFSSEDATFNAGVSLDTETGIEWMKTYGTKGMSYEQVEGLLDTTLSGWRLPTNDEVESFFTTHLTGVGIYGTSTTHSYNSTAYENSKRFFRDFYGSAFNKNSVTKQYALYKDEDDIIRRIGAEPKYRDTLKFNIIGLEDTSSFSVTTSGNDYRVLLVSDGGATNESIADPTININNPNAPVNNASSVPVPATALLFIGALLGLGMRKRKV